MEFTQDVLFKTLKTPLVAILVFFIGAGTLFFFKNDIYGKTFFMMASYAAIYYAYHNLNTKWRQISKGILIGLAAVMFVFLSVETIRAATSDKQFDFMCFYMQGQLGLHHLDFYDPKSFQIILQSNNFNFDFLPAIRAEILDVGLLSPPITMLLFAPLGSMDYYTGKLVTSILIFIFIFANTFLANMIFVKKDKSIFSFLFIFIIIMLLPGTNGTIGYNQTNFFLLFFILLTVYTIDKPISGFYLALSLIIKPISGFLILFFISDKKWKSVTYFVATLIVLFSITAFFWGFQNIIGYFQSPPTQRLPQYLYLGEGNQSVLSLFNRNLEGYGLSQNMINSIYFLTSIIMASLTYLASKRLNAIDIYFSFISFLLCMLMIYPSSLNHYMVYLTPMFVYFLLQKQEKKYFWIIVLPAISFLRTEAFLSYFILWIVLIGIGLYPSKMNNMKDRWVHV